jgi:hypothetical protein
VGAADPDAGESDGKWVFTANTLTGTITIIDTTTDTLVKSLPCDAGCHGVNFGAKKGGAYYAYISSKFSNEMLVADPDPDGDGSAADAAIVGRVLLTASTKTKTDDTVSGNPGMGGQGVLPVPNVYNGWVQKLPNTREFKDLTCEQATRSAAAAATDLPRRGGNRPRLPPLRSGPQLRYGPRRSSAG